MEDSHGCCWWYLEDTAKHYCGMRLCKQEPGQWYNYENMKIWFIMKICKQKHYTNTINKKWIKLITSRILSHYYYNANWLQTDWQIESVSQSVSQSVATQMFPTETVPPRVFSIKYPTRGLKRTSYRTPLHYNQRTSHWSPSHYNQRTSHRSPLLYNQRLNRFPNQPYHSTLRTISILAAFTTTTAELILCSENRTRRPLTLVKQVGQTLKSTCSTARSIYDIHCTQLISHLSAADLGPTIYTPCFIKTTPNLIAHNFGKCWLIFIFFHPWTQQKTLVFKIELAR